MSEDYCELCDLPRSTCLHGNPPPAPPPTVRRSSPPSTPRAPRGPRLTVTQAASPGAPRRWTPSEAFRPHLLDLLHDHGGRLEAEELMPALEVRLDGVLTPGDREPSPQGGERWHVAVRRQRKELIDEGLLVPAQPGVWELTPQGRAQAG